ncbi:MAG: aspartyl/asparaginyl beta-hydroxylase domain-containing protein [Cyanobium sp.]
MQVSERAEGRSRGAPPQQDLRRRHWTFPARNRRARMRRALHGLLEALLCRFAIDGDRPVFAADQFHWVRALEADWMQVRRELDAVMPHREAMPNFQDILRPVRTIQKDDAWKTFFLKGVGMDCRENARRCPQTMALLERIPGCTTAFFSILSPGKHIPPHRGAWAGVLRLHLALLVPEPPERCRIRIADQIHTWQEGHCLVFDDTYNHQVWNDTDGYRVVLFVDFERPLRWPLSLLNHSLLHLAALAPLLREANAREQASARSFWQRVGAAR